MTVEWDDDRPRSLNSRMVCDCGCETRVRIGDEEESWVVVMPTYKYRTQRAIRERVKHFVNLEHLGRWAASIPH